MVHAQLLHELFSKEVNRKEFLMYFGLVFMTILGLSGFLKTLSSITQGKSEKGFSSGPYGK
jgi:hypothetical protein